ncbi:uncharacterized protein LOC124189945 [Daphnia pulex]|uniref:uncharacterized protein LOC124189945 n=1 Tax=Daphnia pulex TaxID=6669 RepID=UPI001EE0175A|nr:uncharacterized protein LOC124189945 [Daphnia pulex]XP_046438411.1 uncharacterized protein LOC124189945 [Daphnia pulex]
MEKVQIDQLLSTQIPRIDENHTDILLEDEALPGQQPPAYQCYKSVSVPAWNAYALGFQLNTPTSEDSYPFGANQENLNTNKGIVTQIAPEEFSLEDVRHLQKLIRDLHAENIQKTLSYIKLEQAYYSMKDEVADLKRGAKMKQTKETGERSKHPSDESENKDPAKELTEIKEKCNAVQSEEANVPGLVGDERFQYFHAIVSDSNIILTENKKLLDTMMNKVQVLELELAAWMERSKEYERKLQIKSSLDNGIQTDDVDIPQRSSIPNNRHLGRSIDSEEDTATQRERQNTRNISSLVYKYLVPKANSCFSCLKTALCRCPPAPPQSGNTERQMVSIRKCEI